MEKTRRLPAEWEEQDSVLMAWPHEGTEWVNLEAVQNVTIEIVREIVRSELLLMAAPDVEEARGRLAHAKVPLDRVRLFQIDTNDTWARDFGPITVLDAGRALLLDFGFNGWGLKFRSDLDNQITRRLAALGAFGNSALDTKGIVLEGGSIESDGQGTILTTSACLLSPNRNPHLSRSGVEECLCREFGAKRVFWIENGRIAGDDTDSHVDTLARFCPDDVIVYTACDDPLDDHYDPLGAMAEEIRAFRTADGKPYRLFALPWPAAVYDEEGRRLPATYANFLVINGAVLVPLYGTPKDLEAIEIIRRAFPGRRITGVNCLPLLTGNGSLHCITMQLPRGVLG
ncbi:MAG: agmatine deiminase family protein [Deltaproteobacteria bacterium]|nr:agmatine deiminase family protein [Deltaproteobacteria bacterium]MDA8306323.1 agmatine deiminase family protein [Deltaproteobacteria bacterium]